MCIWETVAVTTTTTITPSLHRRPSNCESGHAEALQTGHARTNVFNRKRPHNGRPVQFTVALSITGKWRWWLLLFVRFLSVKLQFNFTKMHHQITANRSRSSSCSSSSRATQFSRIRLLSINQMINYSSSAQKGGQKPLMICDSAAKFLFFL